ncbi:MAG: hypothetical protein WBG36_07635 [Ornithinimicrobium sp.]
MNETAGRELTISCGAQALDAASAAHHVGLLWLQPGPERDVLAQLVAEGDRVQFADRAWRRELASPAEQR